MGLIDQLLQQATRQPAAPAVETADRQLRGCEKITSSQGKDRFKMMDELFPGSIASVHTR